MSETVKYQINLPKDMDSMIKRLADQNFNSKKGIATLLIAEALSARNARNVNANT